MLYLEGKNSLKPNNLIQLAISKSARTDTNGLLYTRRGTGNVRCRRSVTAQAAVVRRFLLLVVDVDCGSQSNKQIDARRQLGVARESCKGLRATLQTHGLR